MSNNAVDRLYFLAIVPPEPVFGQVSAVKLHFSQQYHAYHALKSPPHITVIPPFRLNDRLFQNLEHFLFENVVRVHSTKITLDGFGCFIPRVIYIKPLVEERLSIQINEIVSRFYNDFLKSKQDPRPFHPHLTVAFKDLTKPIFYTSWGAMQDQHFHASFSVDYFSLLRFDSGKWQIISKYPISGTT